jgi:hypothetical protein
MALLRSHVVDRYASWAWFKLTAGIQNIFTILKILNSNAYVLSLSWQTLVPGSCFL